MDTEQKYVDCAEFYTQLAGEPEPGFITEYHENGVENPDRNVIGYDPTESFRDHHLLNEDVPIDGYVQFYNPDAGEQGEPFLFFGFPFRDHRKTDAPWAAYAEKPNGKNHPVWKWQNPEMDPHKRLTLSPSLGVGRDELTFHCYIRDGEIEWL